MRKFQDYCTSNNDSTLYGLLCVFLLLLTMCLSVACSTPGAEQEPEEEIETEVETEIEGLVANYRFDNDKDGWVEDSAGEEHGESTNVTYVDGVVG